MTMVLTPKMIVFDFDGVILNSTDILFPIFNEIGSATSFDEKITVPPERSLRENWGATGEELIKKFHPDIAPMILGLIRSMDDYLEKNPIYCCDLDLIKMVRDEGIKTAILTNRSPKNLEKHFGHNNFFRDNFDILVGIERGEKASVAADIRRASHAKPDARSFEPILKFAAENGIKKEDILFVGDAYTDMKAAENAGIPFAAVLTGALNSVPLWTQFGIAEEMIFKSATFLLGKIFLDIS